MIIVHDIFICKPGQASKMAKLFKEVMKDDAYGELQYLMTDVAGQYNKVVMVTKYQSLADYEKAYESYKNPTEEMKKQFAKMEGYTEMYQTGSREIYQTW